MSVGVGIVVHLERFEGPLALLLHLIRQEEMDIFDINIHEITRQYLDYIKAMQNFDLELAGDFVAMAATLIQIKSKMLLPQYNEEGEVVEVEDPRKELVSRLMEYQRIKEAASRLQQRPWLGRDFFGRGMREDLSDPLEEEISMEENPLFRLISSYRLAMKRMKQAVHRVKGELQSISSRVMEIKDHFRLGERIGFSSLVSAVENRLNQVLVTFLSVLELAKLGYVSVYQTDPLSEIYIETKKIVVHDIIGQVEDYESQPDAAAQVFASAGESEMNPESEDFAGIDQDVLVENPEMPAALAMQTFENPKEEAFEEMASDEEILDEEAKILAEEKGTHES